ncbi:ABC transporter permease [Methanobacterium ferruginis]|uniref:ABC transporter permease n=1 Tax=Methanobacterium ferruginis TaxID=710191 RepID=UPI002572888A|nr:hypothetical protein [Methanobacterium ferruginis]BDZ66763.1 hypothetical protein GCM10025860_02110 [Methanobacterium ferruginis]
MKFRSLLLKNITRNKTRSLLAILGIAIGVATILGLGLVTNDLAESTQNALTADAADFSVVYSTTGGVAAQEELLEGVVVLVVNNL